MTETLVESEAEAILEDSPAEEFKVLCANDIVWHRHVLHERATTCHILDRFFLDIYLMYILF